MSLFISFIVLHCLFIVSSSAPLVPCYFIFGDSLSDNGNNNHLPTVAKVDYSPYGIDFPEGPTGRFTNGRTMQDLIVGHLGFGQFIPPYANTRNQDIRKGVNYASGSAGIRDETGTRLGVNVHLKKQMKQHRIIIKRITKLMRNSSETKLLLNRCIYSVQIGSNDYLNNYFLPLQYNTSHLFTLPEYSNRLVEQLSVQLKALYNNGARKTVVYALGWLGCTPYTKSIYPKNASGCADILNHGGELFNEQLYHLVLKLNNDLPDATFTYISTREKELHLPTFDTTRPCCKTRLKSKRPGGELCIQNSTPCRNRRRHIFWDGVHPSEAWNEIAAGIAYSSRNKKEASPFNIKQLAYLQ